MAISKSAFANVSEINMYLNGYPETSVYFSKQLIYLDHDLDLV